MTLTPYLLNRRKFLQRCGCTAAGSLIVPTLLKSESESWSVDGPEAAGKPYGSGYFGEWISDEFGLPAFRYTCDQTATWSYYYARSGLTYDDYFNERIISQGEIYQYIMGVQAMDR